MVYRKGTYEFSSAERQNLFQSLAFQYLKRSSHQNSTGLKQKCWREPQNNTGDSGSRSWKSSSNSRCCNWKTIYMLQAANKAFDEYGERSLFLTYNKALAVDLLRLMAFCGIKSNDENGGVKIETPILFSYDFIKSLKWKMKT